MHTLIVLLLAAAAACAVPRPFGSSAAQEIPQLPSRLGHQPRPFLSDYLLPQMLMPSSMYAYEDSPRAQVQETMIQPAESLDNDWLDKEIDRINQIEEEEPLDTFEEEFSRWIDQEPYVPIETRDLTAYSPESDIVLQEEMQPMLPALEIVLPEPTPEAKAPVRDPKPPPPMLITPNIEKKKTFALTPLDKEYYEHDEEKVSTQESVEFQPLRQIRQNPNLGPRTKNLVAENLDRLRTGFTIDPESTDEPGHIAAAADPADSIYGIAIITTLGIALTMAIFGFLIGWYALSKKAKAAADVDYPAYGVTGPTIDTSGDRKLAHSAHMYHYQHQKQQIIAMERSGMDRNGSVSDPESEEENEEGDYTVYECPGFATTGEMEVKNPLFSEQPTPATPGKCEIVKPQPKE